MDCCISSKGDIPVTVDTLDPDVWIGEYYGVLNVLPVSASSRCEDTTAPNHAKLFNFWKLSKAVKRVRNLGTFKYHSSAEGVTKY